MIYDGLSNSAISVNLQDHSSSASFFTFWVFLHIFGTAEATVKFKYINRPYHVLALG